MTAHAWDTTSDADLVDNGHTGAHTMSESAFIDPTTPAGQAYWQRRHNAELAHERASMPTPEETIAAEVESILADITWVKGQANHKLDGPENSTLYQAWKKASTLLAALRS